ncbi:MAG: 4Fe-4S dicluster domain-containing protein [Armatimonadota bacterium]|nr:4Fe-4S dicluster domain-containing protein [Armatimonadota bacterium]
MSPPVVAPSPDRPVLWGKVIDHRKCIGCHACTVACKAEHLVPLGVNRTYVKQVEVGVWPAVRRQFQVTRCNQCDDPPCVHICPVTAMFRRPDGIVDFDREVCIGCKACIAACPYDAIYIDPESHSAEKCNFCAHRIDLGLEPACVVVCPERAIVVGNLLDPSSEVSQLVAREKVEVRKPEKGTAPKLYYVEASGFTRVPTGAALPATHAFAQQREGYPAWNGEARASPGRTAAAALVSYDVPHRPPWDWRVSGYTWTKSVASGLYGALSVLSWTGRALGDVWDVGGRLATLVFLLLTAALLVWDLKHPERFWTILVRPQWRSWLARGAFILTGFGAVVAADLVVRLLGWTTPAGLLQGAGFVLAVLAAVYTAFLFAQARARDLWQSPVLPVHLLIQAAVAGSAALLVGGAFVGLPAGAQTALAWILLWGLAGHALLALSEGLGPHPTDDAARAARQMTHGRYRLAYWLGLGVGGALAAALLVLQMAGWVGPWAVPLAGCLALVGLLLYEHGYVQAGQSVPLS